MYNLEYYEPIVTFSAEWYSYVVLPQPVEPSDRAR